MSTSASPTYVFLPEGTVWGFDADDANSALFDVHLRLVSEYDVEPVEAAAAIRAWSAEQALEEIPRYGTALAAQLIARHAGLTLRQADFVGV